MDDVRRELKRGTLELVLLALLAEEDRYGYDIVATLEARGGPVFRIKEGTLYPVLYRLEDRGDITSYRDNPKRGVPRKYYRLTDPGRERLVELKREWRLFSEIVARFIDPRGHTGPSDSPAAPRRGGAPPVPRDDDESPRPAPDHPTTDDAPSAADGEGRTV